MTDQEVICSFMEPKPAYFTKGHFTWWPWLGTITPERKPRALTLDALHEVEERLTEEQWDAYETQALKCRAIGTSAYRNALHLTADQKIRALSSVLRKEQS